MKWFTAVLITSSIIGCTPPSALQTPVSRPPTDAYIFAQVLQQIKAESLTVKPSYELANTCLAGMGSDERLSVSPELSERQIADFTVEAIQKASNQPPLQDSSNLVDRCIALAVSALEDGSDYRNLNNHTGYAPPGGLGLIVEKINDQIIVDPISNFSISKQIGKETTLLSIDGLSVNGLSQDEVIKQLRGKVGTNVELVVIRSNETEPITIVAQRELFDPRRSMRVQDIDNETLYIGITSFEHKVCSEIANAISNRTQSAPQRIILDLRNNLGGMFSEIVACATLVLPADVIVGRVKGRDEARNETLMANNSNTLMPVPNPKLYAVPSWVKSAPLVVLVNDLTASGTEWLTLSLQEHKRGTIIGVKTIGHGKVHSIYPMHTGMSLQLHTGMLHSPSWVPFDKNGITPDIAYNNAVFKDGINDEIVKFSTTVELRAR